MLPCLRILGVSACLLPFPAQAAQLITERTENFPRVNLGDRPLPKYQAGYIFSKNQSHTAIRVDRADGSLLPAVEQALDLPDSFRPDISDVAVSFDGDIAVAASVMDRHGGYLSVIAWFRADGSLVRVVRTAPFNAFDIGFTADGSLWAFGNVKKNMQELDPGHDVLRQYGPDGELARSFLPWSGGDPPDLSHPANDGFLATSRNYAAMASISAGKFALISTDGIVMHEGRLAYPEGLTATIGAVTDSGRIFVAGLWSGESPGNYFKGALFEVDRENRILDSVDTASADREGNFGILMGAEEENLVFYAKSKLVWSRIN